MKFTKETLQLEAVYHVNHYINEGQSFEEARESAYYWLDGVLEEFGYDENDVASFGCEEGCDYVKELCFELPRELYNKLVKKL